jgi:predicted transcriptional regulator of viral defense system
MPSESDIDRRRDGKRRTRVRGQIVAELAARQYGVVSRRQLRARGFSDDLIDEWLARSQLIPVHRGIFAVGRRPLTAAGRCMAGVLAGGLEGALSRRPARWFWGLCDSMGGLVHVTVPTDRRSRSGLVFHRLKLPNDERTVHEGIPITTVARTLFDAAAVESPARLRQVIALAEARALADSPSLQDLMERYPSARGTAKLRAVVTSAINEGVADRELEIRFAEFIDEFDIPRPEKNARIEVVDGRTFTVDCFWRDARLVVELDSRRHHSDWESAEADRARDAALIAIGIPVVRVTWRRLHCARAELARQLMAAIESRPTFAGPETVNVGLPSGR